MTNAGSRMICAAGRHSAVIAPARRVARPRRRASPRVRSPMSAGVSRATRSYSQLPPSPLRRGDREKAVVAREAAPGSRGKPLSAQSACPRHKGSWSSDGRPGSSRYDGRVRRTWEGARRRIAVPGRAMYCSIGTGQASRHMGRKHIRWIKPSKLLPARPPRRRRRPRQRTTHPGAGA